jgi:hypothetical protein
VVNVVGNIEQCPLSTVCNNKKHAELIVSSSRPQSQESIYKQKINYQEYSLHLLPLPGLPRIEDIRIL